MAQPAHTYGPTCHLARSVTFSGTKNDNDDIPDLKAQFFYCSQLPIDDPLSAAPTPTNSESKPVKHPPRPFPAYDNNALDEAWLGLRNEKDSKTHNRSKLRKDTRPSQNDRTGSTIGTLFTPKQKKPSKEEGAKLQSGSNCSTAQGSKKPVSKPTKHTKTLSFSADATNDEAPQGPKSSGNPKHTEDGASTSDYGERVFRGEFAENSVVDRENSGKSKTPGCCTDLEMTGDATESQHDRAEASHDSTGSRGDQSVPYDLQKDKTLKDKKGKHAESVNASRKAGSGQADATDESSHTKDACSFKECDLSKLLAKDTAQCDLGSKEHTALEKHENSKAHQDFEKHSQAKHPDGQILNSTDNKSRSMRETPITQPQNQKSDIQSSKPANKKLKLFEKKVESPEDKRAHVRPPEHEDKKDKPLEKKTSSSDHDKKHKVQTLERSQKMSKQSDRNEASSLNSRAPEPTSRNDQGNDAGITGRPFLKLPSRSTSPQPLLSDKPSNEGSNDPQPDQCAENSCRRRTERDSTETEPLPDSKCKAHKNTKDYVDVPVGVCKLHKVVLPVLQMEPIYWSPVHDIAPVIRGTWFYKDTMYPVECPVANQLETGYRELRPWSQTWKDELHSAVEVGAAGEEKVAHHLWPRDEDKGRVSHAILSTDPYCAARCFRGEAAAEGVTEFDDPDKNVAATNSIVKKYPNAQVIYKDSKSAYILKPTLHPSAYHKRRPLQKIQKGFHVGIHVVRGFDWRSWEKLHPTKKSNAATKVDEHAAVSGDSNLGKRNACVACRSQEERKECSDLVLVVHGIGQKLSERVESFNFTHAINAFRRNVNAELANDAVQKVLRKDLGGVMVLPVNWRSNLSFEDGDGMKEGENDRSGSDFSLKDITPTTIPAVRSLISDVMLDIPYYMSHNKTKMIQAVINEANRVYRLWCKNNPEFHKNGRVHIIAHSLGSVMAIEILSKQPTLVPRVDFNGKRINTKYFDFNTTNLFCAGSPAGFFLLLEKGKLVPRKSQNKPGAEAGDDEDKTIVDSVGVFGCLAVDNIYNIMHQNDPIAYRLNACGDPKYAASLKTAYVPSSTTGFFETIGNAMKSITPGVAAPADIAVGQMAKPTAVTRLPSQLEMDVHNFTAEERAEKKFRLLNDNCQVDYVLTSGGGPLEIQYLNMLGAHSSYWTNSDFIRMFVTEVGRKAGSKYCLPNMKAVKNRQKA